MIVMAQQCEAIYGDGPTVECHEPADFVIDSETPGGSTFLCAKHTKAHLTQTCDIIRADNTRCDGPAVVSAPHCGGEISHYCADHAQATRCEASVTLDDTDAGGPYDFVPCEHPATRIIHWTTDGGMDITVGLCDFHATGEI